VAQVRPVVHRHVGLDQPFVQLPVAHVDRHDLRRAVLQEAVREPPGGRPAVDRPTAGHVEPEPLDRAGELLPTPADEARRGPLHDDGLVRADLAARLVGDGAPDEHPTGRDVGLGALATGRETAPDHLRIEPAAGAVVDLRRSTGQRVAADFFAAVCFFAAAFFLAGASWRGLLLGRGASSRGLLLAGPSWPPPSSWPGPSSPPPSSWPASARGLAEDGLDQVLEALDVASWRHRPGELEADLAIEVLRAPAALLRLRRLVLRGLREITDQGTPPKPACAASRPCPCRVTG
jgi:hypothetical protein